MDIQFTGRHIEITPALKTFTEEKMERLEHRHPIKTLHITLHVENATHIAEGNIHLNGFDIHARADAGDMYSAIDMLVDKLIGQMTKHKEKNIDKHR